MTRFFAAPLLACLMLAQPAVAQYVMDLGSLITALRLGNVLEDIEAFDRANTVYVARVSEISGVSLQGDRLDAVLADRQRVIGYMRSIVRGNREARRALQIHHEALEDVIFVTTTNDGTATLYVDDR